MKRLIRTSAAIGVGALVVVSYVAWSLSETVLHPNRPRVSSDRLARTPATFGLRYADVEFEGSRGAMLRGWWTEPPSFEGVAVIFAHGNGEDRRQGLEHLPRISAMGLAALHFDFSGRGDSDGDFVSLGFHEQEDMASAVKWVAARPGVRRVLLWTRSMGAVAALLAMPARPEVSGAVLDSPFSDFETLAHDYLKAAGLPRFPFYAAGRWLVSLRAGFDPAAIRPIRTAPEIDVPMLFVIRGEDTLVPPAHGERLWRAAPPELGHALRVPGVDHNETLPRDSQAEILAFLGALVASPDPGGGPSNRGDHRTR